MDYRELENARFMRSKSEDSVKLIIIGLPHIHGVIGLNFHFCRTKNEYVDGRRDVKKGMRLKFVNRA